jgi:hypothetical protein
MILSKLEGPDTRLHMGIINRVMEDIYNEFSKNTEDATTYGRQGV